MTETKEQQTTHLAMDEWTELVAKHLHSIEAGAEIVESHVKQLYGVPDWETRALEHVDKAEQLLGVALTRLAKARQDMQRKNKVT